MYRYKCISIYIYTYIHMYSPSPEIITNPKELPMILVLIYPEGSDALSCISQALLGARIHGTWIWSLSPTSLMIKCLDPLSGVSDT